MSADNGIYILVTNDTHRNEGHGRWINMFSSGIVAYRVAHAQAIDNLDWYEKNQPYNVGYYMNQIWGNSPIFYDISEARVEADRQASNYDILEYGVSIIERLNYKFPI